MNREVNAQVLQETQALLAADPEGLLKPEAVVNAWRANPTGVFAPFFTADVQEAAEKRWLDEARSLIRSVELQYDETWLKGPVPAYVSLSGDRSKDGGGYRSTPTVLTNQQLRAELVATARKELEAWARRHKMLRGFVIAVIAAAGIPANGIMSDAELAAAAAESQEGEAA